MIGDIASIGLRGYNYSNIHSNARFAKQFFNGELDINDPNLQFTMTGSIDLRHGKDLIKLHANLDTAFLHKLKLSKEEIFLQSYVDIDSRGLTLDSIVGTALVIPLIFGFCLASAWVPSRQVLAINPRNLIVE